MNAKDEVERLLQQWADRTSKGLQDLILEKHSTDAVIYDVLPPMQYVGTKAYRDSWDDWQPETTGENVFRIENLQVTASDDIAFAFGFIRCGGTLPDGKVFGDLVRATFCLTKSADAWRITHQHISMPRSSE